MLLCHLFYAHLTAYHAHGSRLYRKNTLLSPWPHWERSCHVAVHAHLLARLTLPFTFDVTAQELGTLSSGTSTTSLSARLCSATLILIKRRFTGAHRRPAVGVELRDDRRGGINTHLGERRRWAQVARLGRWHLAPLGSLVTPLASSARSRGPGWQRLHFNYQPLLLRPLERSPCASVSIKGETECERRF